MGKRRAGSTNAIEEITQQQLENVLNELENWTKQYAMKDGGCVELSNVKCFVLKVNELHFYSPLRVYFGREYIYPRSLRFASFMTVRCKH